MLIAKNMLQFLSLRFTTEFYGGELTFLDLNLTLKDNPK